MTVELDRLLEIASFYDPSDDEVKEFDCLKIKIDKLILDGKLTPFLQAQVKEYRGDIIRLVKKENK